MGLGRTIEMLRAKCGIVQDGAEEGKEVGDKGAR